MLATLTTSGSGAVSHPDRVRTQLADDALGDDPLLATVLVAAQQLLAEVVVDGGVGAAPGRAGQRHGRGAGAGAADQQLRGWRRGRPPPGCRSRSRSRTGTARAGRRRSPPDRARRRPRPSPRGPARPCSSRRRPIRSVAAATARFEVARRAHAANLGTIGQVRVEQRQRIGPQAGETRHDSLDGPTRVVAGRDDDVGGEEAPRRRCRQSESSGRTSDAGANEDQAEDAAPSGSKAKPPVQTGPAPDGSPGGSSRTAPSFSRRHSRATSAKRPSPRELASWATPSAASANFAIRLLPAEPVVRGQA